MRKNGLVVLGALILAIVWGAPLQAADTTPESRRAYRQAAREALIADMRAAQVLLDEHLLLMPYMEHRERVLARIAPSLDACRAAIDGARARGL